MHVMALEAFFVYAIGNKAVIGAALQVIHQRLAGKQPDIGLVEQAGEQVDARGGEISGEFIVLVVHVEDEACAQAPGKQVSGMADIAIAAGNNGVKGACVPGDGMIQPLPGELQAEGRSGAYFQRTIVAVGRYSRVIVDQPQVGRDSSLRPVQRELVDSAVSLLQSIAIGVKTLADEQYPHRDPPLPSGDGLSPVPSAALSFWPNTGHANSLDRSVVLVCH